MWEPRHSAITCWFVFIHPKITSNPDSVPSHCIWLGFMEFPLLVEVRWQARRRLRLLPESVAVAVLVAEVVFRAEQQRQHQNEEKRIHRALLTSQIPVPTRAQ